MYADVSPTQIELAPNASASFAVRISNATDKIDAYDINLFGLDPSWVSVEPKRLSLFPSETESAIVTVTLPADFPSGIRVLSLHVRSANDPADFSLVPTTMLVIEQPRLSLRMDPVIIHGGSRATFGLVIHNEGNAVVHAAPEFIDPEAKCEVVFDPREIDLPPGGREVIEARIQAPRPWLGSPKVRTFTFAVETHQRSEALASFVQKPRLGRLLFAMLGLLTAAAVFAVVLSRTFDKVVDEASVDQASLAAALDQGGGDPGGLAPVNPGMVSGTVTLFTNSTTGVPGVQADLFAADDANVPLYTAATNETGAYSFPRLREGTYKLRLRGAGFADIWYPEAPTAADAGEIEVKLKSSQELAPVRLGGLPGSITGKVKVADPTGALATLVVPGAVDGTPATVKTVEVSADGTFAFESVPSPATYQLLIEKAGYAPTQRDVVVGPAEAVDSIEVVLRKGDGVIEGTLFADGAALGGVTVQASDGTTKISTVSLTRDGIGTFRLRALPTPAVYTVTFSKRGFSSETRTLSLDTGGTLSGVDVQLQRANGSISGTTTVTGPDGTPAGAVGGVTVTVAGGDVKLTTTTVSAGAVGTWFVPDLPLPATYTVTFSKAGLVDQVRLVDLDPLGGTGDVTGVDVEMVPATAVVGGLVRGSDGVPVATATVSLSDGTTTRTLSTAHDPLGRFTFDGVFPGAYTLTANLPGTTQAVVLVNVTNAAVQDLDIRLDAQASLTGRVTIFNTATNSFDPLVGVFVRLYRPTDFPGSTLNALDSKVTDANGAYTFSALDAPQDYVVAVYANGNSPDPIDSRLLLTQPSTQITVPTFQLTALF